MSDRIPSFETLIPNPKWCSPRVISFCMPLHLRRWLQLILLPKHKNWEKYLHAYQGNANICKINISRLMWLTVANINLRYTQLF